jgi:hypothetical protein
LVGKVPAKLEWELLNLRSNAFGMGFFNFAIENKVVGDEDGA